MAFGQDTQCKQHWYNNEKFSSLHEHSQTVHTHTSQSTLSMSSLTAITVGVWQGLSTTTSMFLLVCINIYSLSPFYDSDWTHFLQHLYRQPTSSADYDSIYPSAILSLSRLRQACSSTTVTTTQKIVTDSSSHSQEMAESSEQVSQVYHAKTADTSRTTTSDRPQQEKTH